MSSHIDEDPLQKQQRTPACNDAQAQQESARRRLGTRWTWLGIAAALSVAAIVVANINGSVGSPRHLARARITPPSASLPTRQPASPEQEVSILAGIPQKANTLGRPTAPVTLQWYGDLECPFCRRFMLFTLPSIINRWVRSGQLKIEYRSMESATRNPNVFSTQQVAALAAGQQDKLWNFVETFYREQGREGSGYVTESYLQDLAKQVPGLSLPQWTDARRDPTLAREVYRDVHVALNAHFPGTPSFRIGRTGSHTVFRITHFSLTSPQVFNEAIGQLLTNLT